jgi:hypothetical protein
MACVDRRFESCSAHHFSCLGRIQQLNLVTQAEIFPTQQCDGSISVLPQVVVERSQVESVSLMEASVGEELDDLELANLVSNRLARR